MINAELKHVKTLEEFYSEIRRQQEEAHGDDYCGQHDAIKKYLSLPECNSYKELGTHQGATAACAMLCHPKSIELIDNNMSKYHKFLKPIAEKYCKDNNIKLTVTQADSAGLGSIGHLCDILLIDSYHKGYHMQKELELHGGLAKKYIIAHDTTAVPELEHCLRIFAEKERWKVIEQIKTNVGFMVLKK